MKKYILLSFFFILYCSPNPSQKQLASKGNLDLRNWNFLKQGSVSLQGEWEFYWQNLLMPQNRNDKGEKVYIQVPSYWDEYTDKKNVGIGYASYRLFVQLPISENRAALALKVPNLGTSYRLYINGRLVKEVGRVSENPKLARSAYQTSIADISNSESELEIIIHVANYNHIHGGFWYEAYLGLASQVKRKTDLNLFMDFFLFGSILIISIYHLNLFLKIKKNISNLYFAMLSLLFALRPLLTREFAIFQLFPSFPWELAFRIEYLTIYLGTPSSVLFMSSIFPQESYKNLNRSIVIVSSLLACGVVFLPVRIFTGSLELMEFITIFCALYCVYMNLLACYRKREGSNQILFGFCVFSFLAINDVLYDLGYIQTNYYVPIGFLFLVLSQAFFLSNRFSSAFLQIEELTVNLDDKIKIRTKELKEAKEKADEANRLKDKFLLLVAHDLRSPLVGILVILEHVKGEYKHLSGAAIANYLDMIRKSLGYSIDMVDKILDISKLETGDVKLSYELVSIHDLLQRVQEEHQPSLTHKNITWAIENTKDTIIIVDFALFSQIFSNLVANAIKYTPHSGEIRINYFQQEENLLLEIKDTGVGIALDVLPYLFDFSHKTSKLGIEGEFGSGIGLLLVKQLIHKHHGSISAQNLLQGGACFQLSIPNSEKLLFVADDNIAYRKQLASMFRQEGWFVIEFSNGKELLNTVDRIVPVIILSDENMPEMTGTEVFQELLLREDCQDALLFLLSTTVEVGSLQIDNKKQGLVQKREQRLSKLESLEFIKDTVLKEYKETLLS
ncbi:MAG: 7TM diverse intracellular signaling domain-containing protein [Spirochaetota bacterium]